MALSLALLLGLVVTALAAASFLEGDGEEVDDRWD